MSKKKRAIKEQSTVKVRNISDISGNVNVAGGNITTHQAVTGISVADIKQIFDQLYSAIEARKEISPADKEDLKAEVGDIQSAVEESVKKNEKVDENFLTRRFRNIARIAPDVLDVIVATLGSPLAGLGTVISKIAEKAKEETTQS